MSLTIICIDPGPYKVSLTRWDGGEKGKYSVIASNTWLGVKKYLIEDNTGLRRWYESAHFEVYTGEPA